MRNGTSGGRPADNAIAPHTIVNATALTRAVIARILSIVRAAYVCAAGLSKQLRFVPPFSA